MPVSIEDIESRLGLTLPPRHRLALLDSSDPIHRKTTLLTAEGNRSIFAVNDRLRKLDWKKWPDYLVAFGTNECGDYYAFDTRASPYRIYYIDPIDTAPESITGCEEQGYIFESFD